MKTKPMMAAIAADCRSFHVLPAAGRDRPRSAVRKSNSAQTNTTGELRFKAPEGWVDREDFFGDARGAIQTAES